MSAGQSVLSCPGCGAPLTLFIEASDRPGEGVLVCEHGHLYDLEDPADDSLLRDAWGPSYRKRCSTLPSAEHHVSR
jgi:hypothetical protein